MPEGYPRVEEKEVVLLEKTEFEMRWEDPVAQGEIPTSLELKAGEIYTIYFDGIGYECEAYALDGEIYMGDFTNIFDPSAPSNPNAPFMVTNIPSEGLIVVAFSPEYAGTHTLSITHHKREVTRMSPEFLPEGGGLVVEIDWDNNTVITPLDAITEAWLKRIPMVIYDEGDGYCNCYYFSWASGYYGSFQSAEFTRMYRDYSDSQVMRVESLLISSDGSVNIENYRFEHDEAAPQ